MNSRGRPNAKCQGGDDSASGVGLQWPAYGGTHVGTCFLNRWNSERGQVKQSGWGETRDDR